MIKTIIHNDITHLYKYIYLVHKGGYHSLFHFKGELDSNS